MPKTYLGVGKDMGGTRVLNVATPTTGTDASNKDYVDSAIQGLTWKQPVRAASTANVSVASAPSAIDGVTLANLDRVLLKDQTAPQENGIYQFNGVGSALTRTNDADSSDELVSAAVLIAEGSQGDTQYTQTANAPITVGTTALTWAQIGGGVGGFTIAGDGLVGNGSTVDAVGGMGIAVDADSISVDTAVVERKVNFSVGDGSATAITLTHNLNTRDCQVTVYRDSAPFDEVDLDVAHDTVNTVILTFATPPAASAFRAHVTA